MSSRATNVYLFKNGYGMIVKTFEFAPNKNNENQSIELFDPPSDPIHGTFWIQPVSNKTSINSIRTKKTSTSIDKNCLNIDELLEGNVGNNVELLAISSSTQTKEWISGTIKSIKRSQDEESDDEETPSAANETIFAHTGISAYRPAEPRASCLPFSRSGNLVLLETTDGDQLALSLSDISSVRAKKNSPFKTSYSRKVKKNCLEINYQNRSETKEQGLMKYLTFGLTWAPSYNLVLLKSNDPSVKKLHLSSKAVILNDTENLNVENLYCIVGFPNVSKFASVIDPMISGNTVREFLDQLTSAENARSSGSYGVTHQSVLSNSIMTQQCLPTAGFNQMHNLTTDENQQDTNVDDLHVYEFRDIVLEKKGRLMLPIFDVELDYKDVYNCKINKGSSFNYRGHVRDQDTEDQQEVWHSIEFENQSNFVWTTAPVVVTKGKEEQQFLAQDTLTYTPKGSTTFVNLTKALDIRVQFNEQVTGADSKRFKFFNQNYQTDHVEGKIIVINLKPEQIVLVINLSSEGKFNNYSIKPKKDIIKSNDNVVNQQHEIQWEIKVQPKGTTEIVYTKSYNKRV